MNYRQAQEKYWKTRFENKLPRLAEDERIYLNVDYMARGFAKYCHCGFDSERKLWFTGCKNAHLDSLVGLYGVNKATSDKARKLLEEALFQLQKE